MANTEVGIFEFGDKTLVFEVRGLETDPLRGAGVGVIFYGSEGYVVMTELYGRRRPSIPSGKLVEKFQGDGDHFGNFVDAVKAHDSKLLRRRHPGRPPFLCATATWPTFPTTSASRPRSRRFERRWAALKTNENVTECLDRMDAYLTANGVELAKTPLMLGPCSRSTRKNETVVDNPEACAILTRDYRAPFIVPKAV